jgi:hypothetical protein
MLCGAGTERLLGAVQIGAKAGSNRCSTRWMVQSALALGLSRRTCCPDTGCRDDSTASLRGGQCLQYLSADISRRATGLPRANFRTYAARQLHRHSMDIVGRAIGVGGTSTSACLQIEMGWLLDSSEGFAPLRTLSTKLAARCKFTCTNVGHAKR